MRLILLSGLLALGACSVPATPTTAADGGVDGGALVVPDLGFDAGASDLGSPDAGELDLGTVDAAVEDLGVADQGPGLGVEIAAQIDPQRPLRVDVTVRATEPVELELWVDGPSVDHRRYAGVGVELEHAFTLLVLRPETMYRLSTVARTATGERVDATADIMTGALPQPRGRFELETAFSMVADDRLLLTGHSTSLGAEFIALDREAIPVWYELVRNVTFDVPTVERLEDGRLVLMLGTEVRVIAPDGRQLGRYVLPTQYEPHHEAVLGPDDHLFFLAYDRRTVDVPELGGPTQVLGDIIVELDPQSRVVREARLLDVLDPTRFPGVESRLRINGYRDWSHANGLSFLPQGDHFLVSLRNQSWIVKLERKTGQVVWRMGQGGDFALLGGDWFFNQHAGKLSPDGRSLTVYDNGNERPNGGYSRAVAYDVEEAGLTVDQRRQWVTPFFTGAVGDLDVLPDRRWLVTAGIGGGGTKPTVYEVDEMGTILHAVRAPGRLMYRTSQVDAADLLSGP